MRFGINSLLFTGSFDESDLKLLDHVKALGFDTLEATPVDPAVFPAKALKRRAADLGLTLNANFALPKDANTISPDPAVREKAVELSKRVVDLCLEAGAEIYCGANYCAWGYMTGKRRTLDEWKWGVDCYRRIGEYALGSPLMIAVETLNRFESFYLNTAADACRFIDEVGLPNCKVHLDTFHMMNEEDDIAGAIRATGDRLGYFHACGSHRGIPGRDLVPWDVTFQALKDVGYANGITLESFNPNLERIAGLVCIWRDFASSPEELATEGLAFIKKKYSEFYTA
jgi:D-psicose/D-tagatose/L-ribulose 3-epimerase